MAMRDDARRLLDELPDEKMTLVVQLLRSIKAAPADDLPSLEQARFVASVETGLAEADAGLGMSHDAVVSRLVQQFGTADA